MPPIEEVAANPLDAGSNANSVESAAEGFTEMLQEEAKPSRSESSKNRSARRSEPEEDDRMFADADTDAPGPDDDEDGHADDDDADPFLTDNGDKPDEDEEGDDDADKDEEADDEADEKDEDDEDDEIDMDAEIPVTVAGEVQNVKMSELTACYSREADYRQKTARLSEERAEVEEYAQEAVAERTHYAETLQTFVDLTTALMPSQAEWDSLKKSSPELYIQTREQWDALQTKVNEAEAERQAIAEREAADADREWKKFVNQENAKLQEKIPALANPKRAKEFQDKIFKYAKDAGFTREELLQNGVDHRNVITLYKAAKYDEIMQSRKSGQRSPKKAPKQGTPSSQPRRLGKKSASNSRLREADRRLSKSGSVDDAALSFTALLNS